MTFFSSHEVEVRAFSVSYPLSAIQPITRAFDFQRWMGHFPVSIATNRLKVVTVRFTGCHFATFLCLFTLVLQFFVMIGNCAQILRFTTVATWTLLLFVNLICFYGSSIVIPRVGLFRKDLLQFILNNLVETHTLLAANVKHANCFRPWMVVVFLEFFAMFPDIIWVLISNKEPFVFSSHPIFRFGTDNVLLGLVIQALIKLYCNISIWILPLQFFSLCRHTAKYFAVLGDLVSEVAKAGAHGQVLSRQNSAKQETNKVVNNSLEDQLIVTNTALVKLVKAANALNTYFGFPMLAFLTFRFLNIVGNLHFCVSLSSQLARGSYNILDVINCVRSLTRDVSGLLFVIWIGDLLPAAVTRFKQQVWEIPYVPASSDFNVRDVDKRSSGSYFQWLRNQINALQVDISAFGFFPIGRDIIPPILGAIMTYFLITVQYASSDPMSALKVNATA